MAGLNPKQKAFALEYSRCGNATKAAISAGYAPKGAHVQAHHLLKNPKIEELLRNLAKENDSPKVADRQERQEFWTAAMRGEIEGFDSKDRLKAAEWLAKTQGDLLVTSSDPELEELEQELEALQSDAEAQRLVVQLADRMAHKAA